MKIRVARSFLERARGLIGVKRLAPDEGLLIERCNCIHTFFMRFAIDATFLDKNGNVVKTVRGATLPGSRVMPFGASSGMCPMRRPTFTLTISRRRAWSRGFRP